MPAATVTVSARAMARLRGGHPWVGRDDVLRGPPGSDDVVRVVDERGRLAGSATWSTAARIALRLFDRGEAALDEKLIDERVGAALALRRRLLGGADAFRVVHGEADRLPGLFVDRYADAAVVQTASAAMDAREPLIARIVARHLEARIVVARDDGAARDLEALPRRSGVLLGGGATRVRWHDAGSPVESDLLTDGKTGGFLDQQENHARAAEYLRAFASASIETLDAFAYHGGFALALARAGARAVALDENAAAVERIRANAVLGGTTVEARHANAFDALRVFEGEGRRFDLVVIDPPALAKRSRDLPAAERAYKELNLRGLRLLRPGGILVTCSCSGRLTALKFGAIVDAAARDVGRPVQLIERRGAGRDHPPLVGVPETDYLKCWILRILE